MGRSTGKAPGRASRRPGRPSLPRRKGALRARSRFGVVSLVAGVVAIAVLAVYGHRFLSDESGSLNPPSPLSSLPVADAARQRVEPDRGPETPPLEKALVEAGYERERIGTTDGTLFVETFDPPEVVAHKIHVANPALRVATNGQELRVSGAGPAERVRVVALKRDSEGESFVEADGALPVPSGKKKPRDAGEPRETAVSAGSKRIVLILDDVGFENQPLEEAASIDAAITFAIIPTAPKAEWAAEMLAKKGYEIICHLPMEPLDYPRQSPGREAILVSLTNEEIRARTRAGLRAVPNARGVNNHMGSRATLDRRVMENVAAVLKDEGVFFIDSRTAGGSLAASVVGAGSVPVASRDVFLDDDPREASVRRQLAELVRLADRKEFAVGIGHVYPSTVRVLREEVPRLEASGYTFHFAGEVVRRIDPPPTHIAGAPAPAGAAMTP